MYYNDPRLEYKKFVGVDPMTVISYMVEIYISSLYVDKKRMFYNFLFKLHLISRVDFKHKIENPCHRTKKVLYQKNYV